MCRPDDFSPYDKDMLRPIGGDRFEHIVSHSDDEMNDDFSDDKVNDDFDAWYDEFNRQITSESRRLGVTEKEASDIIYLRGRSRWTQEKEDKLVEMAHNGIPFPNILAGEDEGVL